MRDLGGHGLFWSIVLVVFLLSSPPCSDPNRSWGYLSIQFLDGNIVESESWYISRDIWLWTSGTSQSCSNLHLSHFESVIFEPLSPRLWNTSNILGFVSSHLRYVLSDPVHTKLRWCKRPCAYYANSISTFHLVLDVGDLVFKLNPGPNDCSIPSIVSCRNGNRSRPRQTPTRATLINIQCCGQLNAIWRKEQMVVCNLNARSVRNKTAEIFDYICETKMDLLVITEHWLTDRDSAVKSELCPDGYKILEDYRMDRRGGGTGVIYRQSLDLRKVDSGISGKNSYEFSEWVIKSPSHNLRVVVIYRPPYSSEHPVPLSVFLTDFSDYLESLCLCKEQLLITGDFNIHVDDMYDLDAKKFLDVLASFGLEQHVDQPTHHSGHTLDLTITRMSETLVVGKPIVDQFISDHAAVICRLNSSRAELSVEKISYRKIKSIDLDHLQNDLKSSLSCMDKQLTTTEDFDACVREYHTALATVLDRHAPQKNRTKVTRPVVPWYNEDIDIAKRLRRKAERKWRRTKLESDLNDYKAKKNHTTYLMNRARREFYSKFMEENGADQAKLFRAANKLLGTKDGLLFPEHLDKTALANDIGGYFIRKVEGIREDIAIGSLNLSDQDLVPPDKPLTNTNLILDSFKTLSECDVRDVIQNLAKKSCELDPMPTNLVCASLDTLLPIIMNIVNASLSMSHFPDDWKEALVKPLLKKGAKDCAYKNLRPVSNLQFLSKVTEKAVFNQLYAHMTGKELFPVLQSAYRKFHSTETALLRVVNDILFNMNRKHISLLVLLDLSAAFDTVDHNILLLRLETSFGVTGSVLKWISSYLSGRCQRVSVNGCFSDSHHLPFGVPQGSCLGPLLFSVYASKIFDVIKIYLPQVHAYADDTQLYVSFKPDETKGEKEAWDAMEQCVNAVRAWMLTDKLKLNDDKTEFMIIGTRQQLSKVSTNGLLVGSTRVSSVNEARNLGVYFDSNMNFNVHITKTCNLAFYSIHNIRRIRKYLSKNATKTLIHALVIGRLDYCNSLFYGLPAVLLNKFQRVQNAAARFISNIPRFSHISPILRELHWLPIKYRIIFKINLITFKALQGNASRYIIELISLKHQSNYNLRSNNERLLSPPKEITKKTTGDRAFAAAAPAVWNALPANLRAENRFSTFKTGLKTYFFRLAYC